MKFTFLKRRVRRDKDPKRFTATKFQSRVREARTYSRSAKILPQAKTDISVGNFSRSWKFLMWLLVPIVAAAVYFLAISPYFLVYTAQISGTETLNAEDISGWIGQAKTDKILFLIPGNHWLFLNRGRMEDILFSHTSKILKISNYHRIWPNSVKFSVEERSVQAIWQSGQDYFQISQDRVLMNKIDYHGSSSTPALLHFVDIAGQPVSVGDSLDLGDLLDYSQKIQADWQKFTGSELAEVRTPGRSAQDVFFVSSTGWVAYFDRRTEPVVNLKSLSLILNQEIPIARAKDVAYIDLRLPTTAYYCYRNEPCSSVAGATPVAP